MFTGTVKCWDNFHFCFWKYFGLKVKIMKFSLPPVVCATKKKKKNKENKWKFYFLINHICMVLEYLSWIFQLLGGRCKKSENNNNTRQYTINTTVGQTKLHFHYCEQWRKAQGGATKCYRSGDTKHKNKNEDILVIFDIIFCHDHLWSTAVREPYTFHKTTKLFSSGFNIQHTEVFRLVLG